MRKPRVHYFIVCDDVRTDPNNLLRIDVIGLMTRMRSKSTSRFPVTRPASEQRPDWAEQHEFHFDLRLRIHNKPVYIETRLHYRLPVVPDESWIKVINVHAP